MLRSSHPVSNTNLLSGYIADSLVERIQCLHETAHHKSVDFLRHTEFHSTPERLGISADEISADERLTAKLLRWMNNTTLLKLFHISPAVFPFLLLPFAPFFCQLPLLHPSGFLYFISYLINSSEVQPFTLNRHLPVHMATGRPPSRT